MTQMTNIDTAPSQGGAGRRGMVNVSAVGGRRRRRFLTGAATAAAAALFASSAAWACTLRDGTLEVYNTDLYASCAAAAAETPSECSKMAEGGASQTGMAVFNESGDGMSIAASGFLSGETYLTTWRHPGSLANCHRTTSNNDSEVRMLDSSETGPSFTITMTSPATSTRTVRTGLARICVQDYEYDGDIAVFPTLVSGQIVDVAVVL